MFYRVEIQNLKDGTTAIAPVVQIEDSKTAEMQFHQTMASILASDAIKSAMVVTLGDAGNRIESMSEFYNFEVDTVE